jgi:hypothetical protein
VGTRSEVADGVGISGGTGAFAPSAMSALTSADAGGEMGPIDFAGAKDISCPVVGSIIAKRLLTGFEADDSLLDCADADGSETTEALLDSGGTDSVDDIVLCTVGAGACFSCFPPAGTNVGTFGFSWLATGEPPGIICGGG